MPSPFVSRAATLLILVVGLQTNACAQNQDVRRIWSELCASCHGVRGEGTANAPSMLDDEWTHGGDDETLMRIIREGVPEKGMPSFEAALTAPQMRALVVYLREQRANYVRRPETLPSPPADHVFRTEKHAFKFQTVTDEVQTPWGMTWLPTGEMLVTEKSGAVRLLDRNGQLNPRPIAGTPEVDSGGQGGMMEVQLHPNYSRNGWIYLGFSHPAPNAAGEQVSMTKIVRGRIRDHAWVDEETIFEAPRDTYRPRGGVHFGCRIAFDRKGYIFFTIGERGAGQQAQDLSRPNGKVHRLHDDGRVPKDNPFVAREGALPSIWTYGNRNPQGLAFDRRTGLLWETEHGPRGGDELNLIRPGLNYGWPEVTYGMNYDGTPITSVTTRPDVAPPVIHWTPSIAVCGINFYMSDAFPEWRGNLLVGALAQQEVRRVVIEDREVRHQEVIFQGFGRVRHVAVGPDGAIYLALNSPDMIARLVPAE